MGFGEQIGSLIFGLSVTFAIIAIWIEVRTFTNNLSGLTASWGTYVIIPLLQPNLKTRF